MNRGPSQAPTGSMNHYYQDREPGSSWSLDVFGPLNISYARSDEYFLIMVDNVSRFMFCNTFREKESVPVVDAIMKNVHLVEKQYNRKVKELVMDRGSEFTNDYLKEFTDEMGITRRFSSTQDHAANGRADKTIQTLTQDVKTLLVQSRLIDPKNSSPQELIDKEVELELPDPLITDLTKSKTKSQSKTSRKKDNPLVWSTHDPNHPSNQLKQKLKKKRSKQQKIKTFLEKNLESLNFPKGAHRKKRTLEEHLTEDSDEESADESSGDEEEYNKIKTQNLEPMDVPSNLKETIKGRVKFKKKEN
ncbi:hypothetical protein DAKH74_057760 [Maudiozyma humilis]|uniref:Integrase catalytic domain-containing protein n=1 Tax=Maudiozyma humilis TaxID=51915 RepID=A0AAV5S5J9_MAUHU|nr:hypothetical protein DAKH74_057760 [Kazachstania humilis]